MKHIVVIGAGQIGGRHLQGLSKLAMPAAISVLDPSGDSLRIAAERFKEAGNAPQISGVSFHKNLSGLENEIDLAIIATNADVRAEITKELVTSKKVKNIVFEKVVFQKLSDFAEILDILERKGIKSWVNCPRRYYPFYRDFQKDPAADGPKVITVVGGNWGLACNSVHYMDLAAFLGGTAVCEVDASHLDKGFVESKRKGFKEVNGTLFVSFANGDKLILCSQAWKASPPVIGIVGENVRFIIDESAGGGYYDRRGADSSQWHPVPCKPLLQSELTAVIARDILSAGRCHLSDLSDSAALHAPLLNALSEHMETAAGQKMERCPIT
ncbi:MAG: hypothetical protein CVU77_01745 [Elusimicrobia bacterium HGW-Elusimicrobia-1]|jgi:predicted dehydrogenase|nr:MAG: hypothetical protein CVU77_01745 [Elusimicrobia bacterium HGW-Elusimicrobia-1]